MNIMTKLIITENQLSTLRRLLNEDKYSEVIPKVAEGDVLQIVTNNNDTLQFRVASSFSGQLYLDNLNKGVFKNEIWFITPTSLRDDDLTYGYMNKAKDGDITLKSPDEWPTRTLKNIKELNVVDDAGTVKLRVDVEQPLGDNDLNALMQEYRGMQPGEKWEWAFDDESTMMVEVGSSQNGILLFEIKKVSGKKASRYGALMGRDIEFKVDNQNINLRPSEENFQYEWDIIVNVFLGDTSTDDEKDITQTKIDVAKKQVKIVDLADMSKKVNFDDAPEEKKEEKGILDMTPDELKAYIMSGDNELAQKVLAKPRKGPAKRFRDWLLGSEPDKATFRDTKEIMDKMSNIERRSKKDKVDGLWGNFKTNEKLWLGFGKTIEDAGLESRYNKTYKGQVSKKGKDRFDSSEYVNVAIEDAPFATQIFKKTGTSDYIAWIYYTNEEGEQEKTSIKVIVKDRFE